MMFTQDRRASSKRTRPSLFQRSLKSRVLLWAACLIVGVAALANCQKEAGTPVALAPEDMCAYCKMAISEKRYAAELIDSEGQVFKFDDIGCMANFIKSNKNPAKTIAYFVMDFDDRQWVKAEDAYYVRSSESRTPMNGGIIGFNTKSKAQEAADKLHGQMLQFMDIVNP